ncbi:MAG: SgcJ/EcaC family oxidoreductase [Thermoanaerobaculia bacterium]
MNRQLFTTSIGIPYSAAGFTEKDEALSALAPVAGFVDAWNRHDMNALAELYTADAEFVNVIGMWWHGRDEIRAQHALLHQGRMKQTTLSQEAPMVKLLSQSVAMAHARWELRGDAGAPGWEIGEVRRGMLIHVLIREAGVWKITATQNTDIVEIPNN